MSDRFYIDCYGICDTWRKGKTCKEVKLSWKELCDTLNHLDTLADEKLDEYQYLTHLEHENRMLKEKIAGVQILLTRVKDYLDDANLVLEE